MSLLNQYLKTISEQGAHPELLEPLPPMLKVRPKEGSKGWRVCKAALLILSSAVVAAVITWRYGQQGTSYSMATGVAQAEIGEKVDEGVQPVQPKEMNPTPTTSATLVSPSLSDPNNPASPDVAPEPELSAPAMMMPPKNDRKKQPDVHRTSPTPILDRAAALSPRTEMLLSSDRKPADWEWAPTGPFAPLAQSERPKVSALPAVATIKKSGAVTLSPEVGQNLYQLGLNALQEGKLSDAEHYFRDTLKHMPNDINALLNLATVFIRQENLDSAVETLHTIRKLAPDDVKSLDNLGFIALRRKNHQQARGYYEAALKLNSGDEVALINLAYLAQTENNQSEALHFYDKVLSIYPENATALINTAYLLTQEGKINRAIQLYKRCLKLNSVQNDHELTQKIKQRINLMLAL